MRNELALNKVRSKYECLLREDIRAWDTWGISPETIEKMISSHKTDIEVWEYILKLLENEAENIRRGL
jgi:hypothetical protein